MFLIEFSDCLIGACFHVSPEVVEQAPPVRRWILRILAMPFACYILILMFLAYQTPVVTVFERVVWSDVFIGLRSCVAIVCLGLFRVIKWCGAPVLAVLLRLYWTVPPFAVEAKAAASAPFDLFLAHAWFRAGIALVVLIVILSLGENPPQ
jgi:hypothetical protein